MINEDMRWTSYLLSVELIHISLIGLFVLFLALYLPRRGEITRFLNKIAFIYIFFLLSIFTLSNAYLPLDVNLVTEYLNYFKFNLLNFNFELSQILNPFDGLPWKDTLLFTKIFYIYALAIVAIFLYGISDRFFVANSYEIEFTLLIFFTLIGALFLFSVDNLIEFVLAIEVVTLATYALTAFDRTNRFSTYAGVQYFILGSIPSGLLVLGVTLLYMVLGSFGFSDLTSLFIFSDLIENDKVNGLFNTYTELKNPIKNDIFNLYIHDYEHNTGLRLYSDDTILDFLSIWENFSNESRDNVAWLYEFVGANANKEIKELMDQYIETLNDDFHNFLVWFLVDTPLPDELVGKYDVRTQIDLQKSLFFYRNVGVIPYKIFVLDYITKLRDLDVDHYELYASLLKIRDTFAMYIPYDYLMSLIFLDRGEEWVEGFYFVEGDSVDYQIFLNENELIRVLDNKQKTFTDIHALAYDYSNYPIYILAIFLIFFNLLFKITAAPFHFWAPSIYGKAPIASVTFLSIFSKAMILFAVAKFLMTIFNSFYHFFTPFLIFISVISVLFGMIGAFAEKGIKRFFVYSSMGHVGFMLLGLSLATEEGLSASFHYLPVYIFTSFIMWYIVMYLGEDRNHITHFAILKQEHPMMALIFSLIIFSMSGIPPLGGFFVKLDVLAALLDSSLFYTNYIILLFTVASFFYYLRIVKIIFFDNSLESQEKQLKKTDVIEIKYNNIKSYGSESKLLIIVVLFVILLFYMLIVEKPLIETQLECLKMVIYA